MGLLKRGVIERRTQARKHHTRHRSELADAHRTRRKIDIFGAYEIGQTREPAKRISPARDLKNVGAIFFCRRGLGPQSSRRWRRLKIVEGKDDAHIFFSGAIEERLKRASGTELNVEIFGVRQKVEKERSARREGEIIGAAFTRIARRDDE